jgi:beta-N-acetylhexosaminidase
MGAVPIPYRGRSRPLARVLVTMAAAVTLASCTQGPVAAPASGSGTGSGEPGATAANSSPSANPSPGTTPSGSLPTATPSAVPTTSQPTPLACAAVVEKMSLREQVGQLFMVGISSAGTTGAEATVIGSTRAGSVLLLGNSTSGLAAIQRVTSRLRRVARRPQRVATLIAADQEGGLVQRLKGTGFSTMPSAVSQGRLADGTLAADARSWGRQLKKAGIDVNLAPVADVVPPSMINVNQPIGVLRRYYSTSPSVVAAKVRAFVGGMNSAGVATSVKHFPGLGRVRGNTDLQANVVDSTTVRHDAVLAGFVAGAKAGVDLVMVSSATYSKIDSKHRAAFSPFVIGTMIRRDLGFTGVVISDDLAAKTMQDLTPGTRVIRFIRAGGDLAIIGDPSIVERAASSVLTEAERDRAFAKLVTASAIRVVELKHRRGLAAC